MSETRTVAERRVTITGEIVSQTGLNEATIERLVRKFYADVRRDPILGPIFDDRISDWEPHLQRMCEFWSSLMLMSGRYHGMRWSNIFRFQLTPFTSIGGWPCSRKPPERSARLRPPGISMSGPDA